MQVLPLRFRIVVLFFLAILCAYAQQPEGEKAAPETPAAEEHHNGSADAPPSGESEAPAEDATSNAQRTQLNLLGEVNSSGGESRRNENVTITLLDNNVLKELNSRIGTSANVIDEFKIDRSYFGLEFGGDANGPIHPAAQPRPAFHGDLNWMHNNSIFSARSFFQVGKVQPARTNDYGFSAGGPLWKGASLSITGSQRKVRGQVNGNILVPRPDERTPLATDPATRAIVARILDQYPDQLPNRVDINPRALNTNAPQSIDNNRIDGAFDQVFRDSDRLSLRYDLTLQRVEAFQLVGGQNPDTTTKNHKVRIGWNRRFSPSTILDVSLGLDRTGSLILPDQSSIGYFVQMQGALTNTGGDAQLPTDRVQNDFTYAVKLRQIRNNHTWDVGADLVRRQVNGIESQANRGMVQFANDFGRDTVTNLRLGTPSNYFRALGDVYRAYRQWNLAFWASDSWRATGNLTLNVGLRYGIVTAPFDVAGSGRVPYDSDRNNVGPMFGFAYRLPANHGVIRAAYSVQFGEIFTGTYGHSRFNPPGNLSVQVNTPSLVDPLSGVRFQDLDPNSPHTDYRVDKELATPYSHQYNFSWQRELANHWKMELGYVGSRSHKLFVNWFENRARIVPGIPTTTSTVNLRRPDPNFYDIQHILNGSRGYYDAAKVVLTAPRWHGMNLDVSYWFSKALDLGGDYTTRASGRDTGSSRSPSEFNYQQEMKGRSSFDQPHAFMVRGSWDTPGIAPNGSWLSKIIGQWQVSGVLLRKSGTTFTIDTGSDGPGVGNVDGTRSDRPNLLDPSILGRTINDPDTSHLMLPASAFGFVTPGQLAGNLGRNTFRKDQVWNINSAISRRWTLGRERSLMFRAESLNLMNTPQFAGPGNQLSNPNFGVITNTLNDGRTFNFSLRFSF